MPQSATQQLVHLITEAVRDIETDIATQIPGAVVTDVNSPKVFPDDELAVTLKRRDAIRTLKAAIHQLLATLMPVGSQVNDLLSGFYQTAALRAVLQARIADVIHSLDPDSSKGGVHIDLLAEKTGMNSFKLTHILRFLAIRNVFCEINLNHWANTRLSIPLRTDSPNSLWNFLTYIGEDVALPGLAELPKVLLDNKNGGAVSWDPSQSAFHKYWKPKGDVFEFLATSDDGQRAKRIGKGMGEAAKNADILGALKGFDWKKLGSNGTLIDVGGGIGLIAHSLSMHLPDWKIIVQDRDELVKNGQEEYKQLGLTTNVEFEAINFFHEQPAHRVGATDVYFLRQILRECSFESCVQILTSLRNAAKPTSRLLVCEIDLQPSLIDSKSPILSNGGMAAAESHSLNLTMLTVFNSEERTKEDYEEILNKSGWILESVVTLMTLGDEVIFEGVPDPNWSH